MSQYNKRMQEEKRKRLFKEQEWDERNPQVEKAAATFQDYLKGGEPQPELPKKKQRKQKRWLLMLPVMFLLVAGGAIYWFTTQDKESAHQQPAAIQAQENTQVAKTQIISRETKEYVSQNFSLSLKHPADWSVTDTAGSNVLVINSPKIQLTNTDNQKVDGVVRLQIQNKNYPISGFENGNALAALESELIKYTNPTQNQRAETHLSFLAYAPAAAGINALYITGDYGYQPGQAVPKLDIEAGEPIVSVQFLQCKDEACNEQVPIAINTQSWNDKAWSDPIKTMLSSLSIN